MLAVDRQLLPRRSSQSHRVMGCRGVAVLPEGMSRERFDWLERWVVETKATSSRRPAPRAMSRRSTTAATGLPRTPTNVHLEPFCEFRNHLVHRLATGAALERVVEYLTAPRPKLKVCRASFRLPGLPVQLVQATI